MLVVLLALLTGCVVEEMGGTCTDSAECVEGGSCLKGVCSGYDCTTDADCAEDHVCGQISSVSVCAIPCESSDESTDNSCPGTMECQVFEGDDTGMAALYCL